MKKPHILIFNVDQWRGDTLAHMGNPAAVTPNLDKLAAEDGVSFSQAFCQNPVCTPSRTSFMTGWYPHVRGHRTMTHMLHEEHGEMNLLRLMKKNGYHVWWSARNDLLPAGRSYEDDVDVFYYPKKEDFERWNLTVRPNLHTMMEPRGEPGSDTYYSFYIGKLDKGDDDYYGDSDWGWTLGALDHISDYDSEKPMLMYMPISYPHPPYGVEDPWYSMIDREKMPGRAQTPDWEKKPEILKGLSEGQNLNSWTEERFTELRATYYGMCARVDHQFGMVVKALKDKGIYDDTAIFFFSDHGDFTGDYGLVEKTQNTFEDCLTRVPLLIKPPKGVKVETGVKDALVELVDVSATIFDLTEIDPGYDHFGKSLLPLISGETDVHRDAVFSEGGRRTGETQAMERESIAALGTNAEMTPYWPRIRLQTTDERPYHGKAAMCRNHTHKYVRRLYELDELYDLEKDPQEMVNVIDDPAYSDVLMELKERMTTWYMETCDVVPRKTDSRF